MIVLTGKFTGNGREVLVNTKHKPECVMLKMDSAAGGAAHKMRTMWCDRTNNLYGLDSFNNGIALLDDAFVVGDSTACNVLGTVTYWVAFCKDNDAEVLATGHFGNATSNQVLDYPINKIAMALIKRDSAKVPAIRITGAIDALTDSTGTGVDGAYIKTLGDGSITVSSAVNVNELDGASGIGEGHEVLLVGAGADVETFTYTGDGTTGRTVVTANNKIKAALIYRQTAGGASMRIKTAEMANGYTAPVAAAVLQSEELYMSGNKLITGTSTALNVSGVSYAVITFQHKNEKAVAPKAPYVLKSKGKQFVDLPGRGITSYIDCGTADGSLLISGPITVEWSGILYTAATSQNTEHPIFMRTGGSYSNANATSWGIEGFRSADSTYAWGGPQAHVCTSDRFSNTTEIRASWRTGTQIPNAKLCHLVATHTGSGNWYFYVDGQLTRQRHLDMTSTSLALANINSVSGHKTIIGARYVASGPTYAAPVKMKHKNARVYARGLSHDEVLTRAEIELCDSNLTDITDFAEEWNAANAGGLVLPATSGTTANNGTIVLGQVIRL